MRTLICLLILSLYSHNLRAFSITAGQGYGGFKLTSSTDISIASVMAAGVRINDYIEILYMSVDSSIRMPVLPFRLIDVKHNEGRNDLDQTTYTSYDSDLFGLSLSLPITPHFVITGFYGYGWGKIYETTISSNTSYSVNLMKTRLHGGSLMLEFPFMVGQHIQFRPRIGGIIHFLVNKVSYKHAGAIYAAIGGAYLF